MRKIVILLFCLFLLNINFSLAQNYNLFEDTTKINIDVENKKISEILYIVGVQIDLVFNGRIEGKRKYTFKYKGTAGDFFSIIFSDTLVVAKQNNNIISIKKRNYKYNNRIENLTQQVKQSVIIIDSIKEEKEFLNDSVKKLNLRVQKKEKSIIQLENTVDSIELQLLPTSEFWINPSFSVINLSNPESNSVQQTYKNSFSIGLELGKDFEFTLNKKLKRLQISTGLYYSQINKNVDLSSYIEIDSSRYNVYLSHYDSEEEFLDSFYVNDVGYAEYQYNEIPVFDSLRLYDTVRYNFPNNSQISFSFIEIPLKISYKFPINDKISISAMAGLNARIMLSAKGIIQSDDLKLLDLDTVFSASTKILFSYSFGISAQYEINRDNLFFISARYSPFALASNKYYQESNLRALYFSIGFSHRL